MNQDIRMTITHCEQRQFAKWKGIVFKEPNPPIYSEYTTKISLSTPCQTLGGVR